MSLINTNTDFDVIVVGAGHAGIEAAFASARMGLKTALFTLSLDSVGNMPCNPSIGGTGKGHLVYEIDALGGTMGYMADRVTLQSRTLNTGKGAAVRSKRIQADRHKYSELMKLEIERQENLYLKQGEVTAILTETVNGKTQICGISCEPGGDFTAKAVVLSTGTYLGGKTHIGEVQRFSGPDGLLPASHLTQSLVNAGLSMMRFKTGTPPRINKRSIDFSQLEIQYGDEHIIPYSVLTDEEELNKIEQAICHIVYTNAETHRIIHENIGRSPMYSGQIHGTGPRYCPSIEDKIVRFADKERHQLFVEPMGLSTDEIYLQGFSSSMPAEVQLRMLHSLKGFENAEIMRYAYAIEYDCIDPTQLYPTLELKSISGLYGAGQFNGTSGYEEAAAQGLIAGINAALKVKGEPPVILTRDSSYTGTLIDDLVTKGTNEPYRMMTSRSEYRLLLRQDNADARLTEIGRRVGLISDKRYADFKFKQEQIRLECERLETTTISPSKAVNDILEAHETTPITTGIKLAELVRRPQLDYECLSSVDKNRPDLPRSVKESVQTEIKYAGYVKRQSDAAEREHRLESRALPKDFDYMTIKGLRIEAAQKLTKIQPENIGQASRISGVNPADISVLLIWLASKRDNKAVEKGEEDV